MIKEELLHPAISHFPVALLTLVLVTKIAELIVGQHNAQLKGQLNLISKFLLYTGTVMLLPSLFSGDIAFDIVKENMCSLIKVYQHDDLAHTTLYFFIAAMIFEITSGLDKIPARYKRPLKLGLLLSILTGNYYLFLTAQMGGKLVYQDGAGVSRPFKACSQEEHQ